MDKIFIRQLKVPVIVGVLPLERINSQTILLDLELGTDITAAAVSDDLAHALDYAAVRKSIVEYVQGTQFQLIEALAENILIQLHKIYTISWARLVLTKQPADITDAAGVGVMIERQF